MDDVAGKVMTVAGPVEPGALGVTLVHEHLFMDLRHSSFVAPPAELAAIADARVADLDPALVSRHSCSVRDNLVLEDPDVARAEVDRFRGAGGGTIVDVTPVDIGRSPEELRRVASRCGVNVIMGCGHYCEISYGEDVARRSEDELLDEILGELAKGVGATGVRPGIIGEIGVNGEEHGTHRRLGEMTSAERRVLRSAGQAARLSGAPMTVHLPPRAAAVSAVLDELEDVDAPLSHVSLSHMDTIDDFSAHEEALRRGAWIHYDCFGMALENDWYRDPSDDVRLDWLSAHRESGRLGRVLVSHDVWCKALLAAYGGSGFSHLLAAVVPRLRERGFEDGDVEQLFVGGPAEFLAFSSNSEVTDGG